MKVVKGFAEFSMVTIPDDVRFDELNLLAQDDGTLEFDWAPLRRIVEANAGLTLDLNGDTAIIDLIAAWYYYLRLTGYRHEVAEQWFASCEAAKVFGVGHLFAGPDTLH